MSITIFDFFRQIIFFVLVLVIFAVIFLYFKQNSLIYIPIVDMFGRDISQNPHGYRNPSEAHMSYRDVYIPTKDKLKLYGWLIYSSSPKDTRTLVYLHENAGNIGTRIPFLKRLNEKLDVNIVIIGYRGYGLSEGMPSENGIMIDGEAIFKYVFDDLRDEINTDDVFVIGRSLGGAVSIYTLSYYNYPVKGLILENTFTSMSDVVDNVFPIAKSFKKFVLKNYWPSFERIHNITIPILFLVSEMDELIPPVHMNNLYKLATGAPFKDLYTIPGANHNDAHIKGKDDYYNKIREFMNKIEESNIIN